MENLKGKVAFVTGGASGIGLSMAKAFSMAGMKVAIADIRQDRLMKAEAILNDPDNVLALELDVRDRAALERAADATEARFEKIHVVCNNAGIGEGGPLHEVSPEIWRRVMDINLEGVFNGIQVFVPRIKRHGQGGHIVNTSSMTGMTPIVNTGPYSATKAAVAVMSEIAREELAGDNIGVSVLAPWIVFTPIFHRDVVDEDVEGIQKRRDDMAKRFGDSLTEPDLVGEMVLKGIRNNELYIFNDPVSRRMFEIRMSKIYEAIDRQFPGS
jgi:NAD(P)-dependent dehydrogenase (short-subunit alcohol dehydrogenase family)